MQRLRRWRYEKRRYRLLFALASVLAVCDIRRTAENNRKEVEVMTCPKCNSENVKVESKVKKNPILLGCVLALGGIGLMFLGFVGAAIGSLLGLIIGAITKGLMKTKYETVGVCQNCGNSWVVKE